MGLLPQLTALLVMLSFQSETAQAKKLLVKFKSDTQLEIQAQVRSAHNIQHDDDFSAIVPGLTSVNVESLSDAALEQLRGDENVEYAEEDKEVYIMSNPPNDPMLVQQWGMQAIRAQAAWDDGDTGEHVVVGISDTGVQYDHPDLAANTWRNTAEIPGNGIDDDGNGYVDDVYGWSAFGPNPYDDHMHGTHVAGIVGAAGNNAIGVTGVAWNVKIMALKFMSSTGGGFTSDAIRAVQYAVKMKRRGVNIRVLSNSWGGNAASIAMANAISSAAAEGIIFVAAAGNTATNNDVAPRYPVSIVPTVITVAALDGSLGLAPFSCYGPTSVDIAAPGMYIMSTITNGGYLDLSGTSMATPFVAGVAAVLAALVPTATPAMLKAAILEGAVADFSLQSRIIGGHKLDLPGAVAKIRAYAPVASQPPRAPLGTQAMAPAESVPDTSVAPPVKGQPVAVPSVPFVSPPSLASCPQTTLARTTARSGNIENSAAASPAAPFPWTQIVTGFAAGEACALLAIAVVVVMRRRKAATIPFEGML